MDGKRSEQQVLKELRTLVEGSSKLEKYKSLLDDEFLLHFVRGKKFDTAKAFETLENYFAVRENHTEILADIRSDNIPVLDEGILRVLKRRDEFGRAVFVWKFNKWDPFKSVTPDDFIRGMTLLLEELWKEKDAECNGVVNIFDHAFLQLRHMTPWTPPVISRVVKLLVNNFPLRYGDIYFVNSGMMTHWILRIAFSLISSKLRSRVQILRKQDIGTVRDRLKFQDSDLPLTLRKDWSEESLENESDEDVWDTELEARIRKKFDYYANLSRLVRSPPSLLG